MSFMLKNFKLTEESLSKFAQFESSIAHWSYEHTVLTLKARKMLESIDSLFLARQKLVDDFLASQGIATKDVENVNISPAGEVIVSLREPVPATVDTVASSNGAQ